MLPPVHAGVAYLAYAGYVKLVDESPPTGGATGAAVFAGLFPELIDQPMYHLAGASSTRTVGHAPVVGLGLVLFVWFVVDRLSLDRPSVDRRIAPAVAVGYASHVLADAVWPIVFGAPEELRYLGWPITHQPPYEGIKHLFEVGPVALTTAWVDVAVLVVAIFVWWRDGRPGIAR